MSQQELIPALFRTEYQKIVSVLFNHFGIDHIELAEDIVSDTFLTATEVWPIRGVPDNPKAWLYTVAKNKIKNHFKHKNIYEKKVSPELKYGGVNEEINLEIDLSDKNIADSQLAMMFTICNPCNSDAAQIALALNLLCGFGVNEIADAFLTNREVIYKRINRAKEKLKEENIKIEKPDTHEVSERLNNVIKTIYLLFSEGYYSTSQENTLRKEFCAEAMRLTYLLIQNETTNNPTVNALMALMCFHTSRFEARANENGEIILYEDQDESLWNEELIVRGGYFLSKASSGQDLSRYHLEAGIAFWHTKKENSTEKWINILELYNHLLLLEPSPIAALNRCFAISKVKGKEIAIAVAEKLQLTDNHLYYLLLGHLYTDFNNRKALEYFNAAFKLAKAPADQNIINKHIMRLSLQTG